MTEISYYISIDGIYYEGDRLHSLDIPCPQRPSPSYVWNADFATWEPDVTRGEKEYSAAIQEMLDTTAQAHGYDNIFTACTYADEPAFPKFQQEGLALRAWRSNVWAAAFELFAEVQAGTRTPPTLEETLAALPAAPVLA